MTILIDRTGGKGRTRRMNINMCYYCDRSEYPRGKPIINDPHAQRQPDGTYKCSTCIAEDLAIMMEISHERK